MVSQTHGRLIGDRRRDTFFSAFFILVVFLPAVMFVAGARPENRENRRPAQLPPLTVAAALNPDTYASVGRYLADRLPFRTEAIALDAAARYHVFGTSPNPAVVIGEDGWLFARDALQPPCRQQPSAMLTAVDEVSQALQPDDIAFRLVIVPDKQAIYADRRPGGFAPCSDDIRPDMRRSMAARPQLTTDLWGPLLEAKPQAESPLFWPRDTHWSPAGAWIGIKTLVNDLGPMIADDSRVVENGLARRTGDLTTLIGLPAEDTLPALRATNDADVRLEIMAIPTTPGREVRTYVADDASARTVPGSTLIIHDSAFGVYSFLIAPWFERSTWLHVNELIENPGVVAGLPSFDRIVFERVERFAYSRDLRMIMAPLLPDGPPTP